MNWRLPAHLADALPAEAARIETLRRCLLDLFRSRGYELVMPPMVEYLESLLTGAGEALALRTFKLADQLSGRTLGVRADMTPQAARIDAHLLNRQGVARLCYCGSVLHALPANLAASRELTQIGAELYGYAGEEADHEILRLLSATLQASGLSGCRVELSHVGIFRALTQAAGLEAETAETLFGLLQGKDEPGIAELLSALPTPLAEPFATAFLRLPRLYGGVEVLAEARGILPPLAEIGAALDTLARLVAVAPEWPVAVDLSDLRGYHYHNGVVFAAYVPGHAAAIAQGGRYDSVGKSFGRARPATGFSLDLRELARLHPVAAPIHAVCVPHVARLTENQRASRAAHIDALRAAGEIVIEALPGESAHEGGGMDRQLQPHGDGWQLRPIAPDCNKD
ncbi:MAG: ATP phosphoribosyltransferase regulatory subunit [Zoogloeaceae bacterium]|jgi:ATP phosphoribosyltransferase regulatory subunit|nr:ATP phosphoribosyltransferase regulatory subunit [Zoogloeaceae bacterium]